MILLRRVHRIAVIATGLAAGLAACGRHRAAFVLLVLSNLLLVWSLERLRVELVRREIKP